MQLTTRITILGSFAKNSGKNLAKDDDDDQLLTQFAISSLTDDAGGGATLAHMLRICRLYVHQSSHIRTKPFPTRTFVIAFTLGKNVHFLR